MDVQIVTTNGVDLVSKSISYLILSLIYGNSITVNDYYRFNLITSCLNGTTFEDKLVNLKLEIKNG